MGHHPTFWKTYERTLLVITYWTQSLCHLFWTTVATPFLEECEDDTHTSEMGTWESFGTPKTLEFDCKGENTSPWGVLHVIGKLLKCRCRKWPCMSHLNICSTSYGKKKGHESNCKGVKLVVWFPTTKSWESTRPRCVQMECDTPLESFQWELQVCFRLHPNSRSKQRVMNSQSPGSPNWDSFGCGCHEKTQRILYGGRWWLPPSPGRGESFESIIAHGLF